MNYFALAGAIVTALLGLNAVFSFVRVAFGKAKWRSAWAPVYNLILATVSITTSVWLFSVANG